MQRNTHQYRPNPATYTQHRIVHLQHRIVHLYHRIFELQYRQATNRKLHAATPLFLFQACLNVLLAAYSFLRLRLETYHLNRAYLTRYSTNRHQYPASTFCVFFNFVPTKTLAPHCLASIALFSLTPLTQNNTFYWLWCQWFMICKYLTLQEGYLLFQRFIVF